LSVIAVRGDIVAPASAIDGTCGNNQKKPCYIAINQKALEYSSDYPIPVEIDNWPMIPIQPAR
jgi:hypothetical protein